MQKEWLPKATEPSWHQSGCSRFPEDNDLIRLVKSQGKIICTARGMDKKTKKRIELLNKRLQKLRQQLAGVRQQLDDPEELARFETEITAVEIEIATLKAS